MFTTEHGKYIFTVEMKMVLNYYKGVNFEIFQSMNRPKCTLPKISFLDVFGIILVCETIQELIPLVILSLRNNVGTEQCSLQKSICCTSLQMQVW